MRKSFPIVASLLFGLLLLACVTNAGRSANVCREDSLGESEPIDTADIIVVGSGPGGASFLHRRVHQRPDLSVLWIEKGLYLMARNWPQHYEKSPISPFNPVPLIQGYTWNTFGGGDAANSGGPNLIGLDRPLREPYARWVQVFSETGYRNDTGPIYTRGNKQNRVGQVSSLRTEDGRDRKLLANDLRYSESDKVTYAHARVISVIHEKTDDEEGQGSMLRTTGVRGVRVDADQNEYGGWVI